MPPRPLPPHRAPRLVLPPRGGASAASSSAAAQRGVWLPQPATSQEGWPTNIESKAGGAGASDRISGVRSPQQRSEPAGQRPARAAPAVSAAATSTVHRSETTIAALQPVPVGARAHLASLIAGASLVRKGALCSEQVREGWHAQGERRQSVGDSGQLRPDGHGGRAGRGGARTALGGLGDERLKRRVPGVGQQAVSGAVGVEQRVQKPQLRGCSRENALVRGGVSGRRAWAEGASAAERSAGGARAGPEEFPRRESEAVRGRRASSADASHCSEQRWCIPLL